VAKSEEKQKILRLRSISLFEFRFVAVLVFGNDQELPDGFQRRFALRLVVFTAPVADNVVGAEGNAAEDVLGVDETACFVVGEVLGWKEKLRGRISRNS
jgi:hypothetical protein